MFFVVSFYKIAAYLQVISGYLGSKTSIPWPDTAYRWIRSSCRSFL